MKRNTWFFLPPSWVHSSESGLLEKTIMAGSMSSPYSSSGSSRCGSPDGRHTAIVSLVSSAHTLRIPYTEQKRLFARTLLAQSHFSNNGELLQTMEKGVMYPTVHLLELQRHYIPQRDRVLGTNCLGEDFVLHQAVYEEIRQQFPNDPSRQRNFYTPPHQGSTVYILAGFKVIDSTFQDVMEDSWKDWTGARSLYINLADDFGLHRFSLYRRVCPSNDYSTFMYILLVECRTVTHRNALRLMDFVSRFRVQRMTGYLSVYSTEKLGTASHESSGDIFLRSRRSLPSNGDWWRQVEESAAVSSEVSGSSSSEDALIQEQATSHEDEDEDDEVFAVRVTPTSTPSPTLMDNYCAQRRKNGFSMMPIYENHVGDEVDVALLSKSSATTYSRKKRAEPNGQVSPSAYHAFKNAARDARCPNGATGDLTIQDDVDTGHWTTSQNSVRASDPGYYTLDEAIALAAMRSNGSTMTNGEKPVLQKHLDAKARELLELDEMLQNLQCV